MRGGDGAQTIKRWMYLWITIGLVVVGVVVGFLFGIAGNLEGINEGLEEAGEAVQGAEGDVKPLPAYISDINVSLVKVDAALDPLGSRADQVIDNLGSIDTTLGSVERSLNDTEGSLDTTEVRLDRTEGLLNTTEGLLDTTEARLDEVEATLDSVRGTLVDTVDILMATDAELNSGLDDLVSILSLAQRIERELELAQEFDSLGTNGIWRRVRFLNGGVLVRRENDSGLEEAEEDTDGIIAGLQEVAKHLENTCQFIPDLSIFRDPGQQPPSGGGLLPGLTPDKDQSRPSARASSPSPTDDGQPPSQEGAPPSGGPPGAGEEEPPERPPAGGPGDTRPC